MAQPTSHEDSGLWIVVALILLVFLVPGVFMMGFWGTGMMGGGTWGWGGWLAMGLGSVVLVVVLLLVIRAIQATPRAPAYLPPAWTAPPPAGLTAIQILDTRYAKGEITRDEYLRMRADLEGRAR